VTYLLAVFVFKKKSPRESFSGSLAGSIGVRNASGTIASGSARDQ